MSGVPPRIGTYQNRYSLWADTSLATTQGILRGVGFQGKLLATEQGILSVLRALSASNLLNRNDAINLSSQLAAEQVGQLQKLRELQLEDMTSKAAYQGYPNPAAGRCRSCFRALLHISTELPGRHYVQGRMAMKMVLGISPCGISDYSDLHGWSPFWLSQLASLRNHAAPSSKNLRQPVPAILAILRRTLFSSGWGPAGSWPPKSKTCASESGQMLLLTGQRRQRAAFVRHLHSLRSTVIRPRSRTARRTRAEISNS